VLRRRRVFLCLTHDRRFAYVEWLLRVWIADLRGSRGEGLDRAETCHSQLARTLDQKSSPDT